jgi:acetoin utilization deacetylase AcuC-like enzyme
MRVYWHDDCLLHDTGTGVFGSGPSPLIAVPELHPENVERVRNMRSALERGPLAGALEWHPGRHACEAELATIHHAEHIDRVRDFCAAGGGFLTASTPVVPASWQAALAAAGTTLAAAEAVLAGECTTAYALVRPPGHHAQPDRPDGYCLFANAALAAELARRRGVERIAVVDWDVHHGNGTQECFYERADVLTVSLHMDHRSWGADHPQSGLPDEVGRAAGAGFNVNVAFPMGVGDEGYLAAMAAVVEPLVREFDPGLLIVTCGQDASQYDPNGRQCVTMAGFHGLGRTARRLAGECCAGRLLLVQEGGYGRTYSGLCLLATVAGVLGADTGVDDPLAFLPDPPGRGDSAVAATREALSEFWPVLGAPDVG